jgi:predicted dienelactone hydrolase
VRPPAPRITGVGKLTLTLSEPSSASIATAQSASGPPVRDLPTVVRYPIVSPHTGSARFPLVVFSQGFDEPAEAYSGLLNAWARAGYVVADPTYPLTDPSAPGGVNESDIVNHPADLRFVISTLRAAGRDPHSRLHGVLDPREVAVAGQSDGADVSLTVAANSCCRVAAVKAAMILSGAEQTEFGGTYYGSEASVPLLVTQGSADTINLPGCSSQLYDQAPPPKYYLDIIGAPHLPPYVDPGPTRRGIELVTIAFLNDFLKHHPARLARARSHLPPGETLTSAASAPGATGQVCPGAP